MWYFLVVCEPVLLEDLSPDVRGFEDHLPSSLAFNMKYGSESIDLRMEHNANLNENAPIYEEKIINGKRTVVERKGVLLTVRFSFRRIH